MLSTLTELIHIITGLFKSQVALQIEILALRHQLNVLQRKHPKRVKLKPWDRIFWIWLSRIWPGWKDALVIIKPDTVIKWHKKGFKLYWRYLSKRRQPGRPKVPAMIRKLIRQMSRENPLWGAPRMHGELLKWGMMSGKHRSQSTWLNPTILRHRAGEPFLITTRIRSLPWTFSPYRPSFSRCCTS
ncbi:hypothetical protein Mmc1_2786 [Magnetococcus marinus MC-1]|uniref:Uncharacterized protein n=1 Tax=Magnetococcus marinus (strain ATCC BAA-1437 / JCM 17883 / MC-1) TaxID=156889 RepID=A0LBD6_MAGMM|nr:hypothetical protein Mmc1_2786 [Magnetococcus marinus MC-1]